MVEKFSFFILYNFAIGNTEYFICTCFKCYANRFSHYYKSFYELHINKRKEHYNLFFQ